MSHTNSTPSVALLAVSRTDMAAAMALGDGLGLPVLESGCSPEKIAGVDAVLLVSEAGLSLQQTGRGAPGPVSVDFGSSAMRHRRRSGHNELLGRAVGVGRKPLLRVLDATAGLGQDSFVLADLGCQVTLCEREPIIARMLQAGMQAALALGDPWLDEVLGRMRLVATDARNVAAGQLVELDVIYLDPMFPQRGKSAAVKKEMALFQLLLDSGAGPSDADDLLLWTLSTQVPRLVVKRPPRAPHLAGRRPSHAITGKAVRYDVYQQH